MYVNSSTDGPLIRQPGRTVTVKSGSNLTLECIGYGHPPPHMISWSRVGLRPLPPISSPRDEVIQLNNIPTSADGRYICTVSNYYVAPDYARTVNTETVYVDIKGMSVLTCMYVSCMYSTTLLTLGTRKRREGLQ